MLTFMEWREVGENLGRFASIREKADSPMDRIVIQNRNGIQKVVAGDFRKTIIATIGATNQPDLRAVVSSRLLLSTLKTLKGKGNAEIRVEDWGAQMQTSFGSSIQMKNIDGYFKMLSPLPFKAGGWTAKFPAGFLPAAARYLEGTGKYSPFTQVLAECDGNDMYFRSSDEHIMATVGPIHVDEPRDIHFPDDLFPAMRGLEDAGGIYLPERFESQGHQAQFGSGKYRVVSVLLPGAGKFPNVAEHRYTVNMTADKKVLIDTFKSLAGRHQYNRVVMEAKDGEFTIRSGDNGAARLNVECEGTGSIPVNATFMAKVLQTVDGKNATVQYADAPSHVRIYGDGNNWPLLVAPMK
jgi:DNA polymerase III sliding clamp (beta) subunit (PCNA family)